MVANPLSLHFSEETSRSGFMGGAWHRTVLPGGGEARRDNPGAVGECPRALTIRIRWASIRDLQIVRVGGEGSSCGRPKKPAGLATWPEGSKIG